MKIESRRKLLLVKEGMEAVIDSEVEMDRGGHGTGKARLASDIRQEAMAELRERFPLSRVGGKRGRPRKALPDETKETILFRYYLTEMSMAAIAERLKLSNAVVTRTIDEGGKAWYDDNKDAVDDYRGRRFGGLRHVPRGK